MLEFLGFSCTQQAGLKYDADACNHKGEQRTVDPMAETPAHLDTIRAWQHSRSRARKREAGFCGVPDMSDLCDGEEDVRLESLIEALPVLIGSEPEISGGRLGKTLSSRPGQILTKQAASPSAPTSIHLSGQSVMPIVAFASSDFEESDEQSLVQDADFGLSDEQLQRVEDTCQGPIIRNLTGSMQEELVRTDSDFGISERQLRDLVRLKQYLPI
eukprot:TRINITY_DN23554_c0_g1_i1.p1 TRINITY_DN23554_c0_g1~~TRINITY_DN23554_c0_g1_i1.p1  ORF type:complete len:215 (-),score=31.62 TRINITY_DN23554_c0_g1_i1:442-1086(-)